MARAAWHLQRQRECRTKARRSTAAVRRQLVKGTQKALNHTPLGPHALGPASRTSTPRTVQAPRSGVVVIYFAALLQRALVNHQVSTHK